MANTSPRLVARLKRKKRIRKNIFGNQERPRLSVFRTAKHIYAQIIDDTKGITLVAASTLDKEYKDAPVEGKKQDVAKAVGNLIGKSRITSYNVCYTKLLRVRKLLGSCHQRGERSS